MQSINYFKEDNSKNDDYAVILELVKGALKDAKLLDQITIEERNEGFLVKPKIVMGGIRNGLEFSSWTVPE